MLDSLSCSFTIAAKTISSVRLYLQQFVGGRMSYLRYLCLSVFGGVQHILCYVFFFLRTLCCQFIWVVLFFVAPSVFSNVYLHLYHF